MGVPHQITRRDNNRRAVFLSGEWANVGGGPGDEAWFRLEPALAMGAPRRRGGKALCD